MEKYSLIYRAFKYCFSSIEGLPAGINWTAWRGTVICRGRRPAAVKRSAPIGKRAVIEKRPALWLKGRGAEARNKVEPLAMMGSHVGRGAHTARSWRVGMEVPGQIGPLCLNLCQIRS